MKRKNAARGSAWSRRCMWALAAAMLVHGGLSAFELWRDQRLTSFPWWSGFVFAGMYYTPPLLLCAMAYVFFRWKAGK